jgi:oligopeptide/dipeptide ABC transporter ATP-binding protein
MALILISHDFGVVASICDRIQVMYSGRLVERGTVQDILERASHPYTSALIRLIPRLDAARDVRLQPIPGQPAVAIGPPRGCRFAPRCEYVQEVCRQSEPPLVELEPGHLSACWFAADRPGEGRTAVSVAGGPAE